VLEPAALAVALQAPVLTLAAAHEGEPPALVRQWADSGLRGVSWDALHPASAAAEQQRWWSATVASGAAATVAAASAVGVRLGLAHVVAPSGQWMADSGSACAWMDDAARGESWLGDALAPGAAAAAAAPPTDWWRDAQALWLVL
jgi:hypothetical protein